MDSSKVSNRRRNKIELRKVSYCKDCLGSSWVFAMTRNGCDLL